MLLIVTQGTQDFLKARRCRNGGAEFRVWSVLKLYILTRGFEPHVFLATEDS